MVKNHLRLKHKAENFMGRELLRRFFKGHYTLEKMFKPGGRYNKLGSISQYEV